LEKLESGDSLGKGKAFKDAGPYKNKHYVVHAVISVLGVLRQKN
jgi:hypothetical protein